MGVYMPKKSKTVVITGATGGIGYHSALGIAESGARVVIIGRNPQRGEIARQSIMKESKNNNIEFVPGDVSSISALDSLAKEIRTKVDSIDVLIHNAGYLGDELRKNEDGLELHFAVNVLAPYRLTMSLLPELQAAPSARVLNITGGDKPAKIDGENLQAEKGCKGLMTYTHSKSIMESMSVALSKELEPQGISVNIIFPGRASTSMTRSLTSKALPGFMKLMYPFFTWYFADDGGKSAKKASQSTIWGATSSELNGVTGCYFDTNMKEQKLHPTAYETHIQEKILTLIHQSLPSESN